MTEIAYVSGPMTGYPEFNYPAFHQASRALQVEGYAVLSPADNFGGNTTYERELYMEQDIRNVLNSDLVVVLPGWERSAGARLEVAVAYECGIPVYRFGEDRINKAQVRIEHIDVAIRVEV
jgi:hypothetical protein